MILILWASDAQLKRSDLNGYAPPGADVLVSFNDLGASWESLAETAYWQEVRQEEGDLLREPLVALRKRVGIRLTPSRWNTWMGPNAVIASTESGWGVCARPGLLWRAVHAWNLVAGEHASEDIWTYRGWYYGWRDGHLVLSSDDAFVDAALSNTAEAISSNASAQGVRIRVSRHGDTPQHDLLMETTGNFSFVGTISKEFSTVDSANGLEKWPVENALVSISGARAEECGNYLASFLPKWRNLDEVRNELTDLRSIGWSNVEDVWRPIKTKRTSVILHDLDTEPFLAVPSLYIRSHLQEPVNDAVVPKGATPYAWGSVDGWYTLRKGVRMMSWLAPDRNRLHAGNNLEAMNAFVEAQPDSTVADVDIRIALDWKRTVQHAENIIGTAVEHELIRKTNREDADNFYGRVMPWFRYLGRLELEGVMENSVLQISGALNAPVAEGRKVE